MEERRSAEIVGSCNLRYSSGMARRPLAREEIERLRRQGLFEGAQALASASLDLIRWTLASLLVVNGGAIVALIGSEELLTDAFDEWSIYFFTGGMIAAVFGGMCCSFALSFYSADGFKRAWDPTPLEMDDFTNLKTDKNTRKWMLATVGSWILSLLLFGLGCISTAFIPEKAEIRRLSIESMEASLRSISEARAFVEVSRNPNATAEQKREAFERARAARIEAAIRSARFARSMGGEEELLNVMANETDAMNALTNSK